MKGMVDTQSLGCSAAGNSKAADGVRGEDLYEQHQHQSCLSRTCSQAMPTVQLSGPGKAYRQLPDAGLILVVPSRSIRKQVLRRILNHSGPTFTLNRPVRSQSTVSSAGSRACGACQSVRLTERRSARSPLRLYLLTYTGLLMQCASA